MFFKNISRFPSKIFSGIFFTALLLLVPNSWAITPPSPETMSCSHQIFAAMSMNTAVNRKDFGISFNTKTDDGGVLLGDDVELRIDVQGVLEK